MPRLTELYTQLKKRRVIRAGVVYIAVFWLSLQVIDMDNDPPFVADQSFNNNTDTRMYDVFGRSFYLTLSASY